MVFRRIWLLGIMAWFAEPVIYLVAMGLGLGRYLERIQGIQYIAFIAPGLLAVSTMFGATFSVTWDAWFKMERTGVYHAAASTPISFEDVAIGEVLWGATRATIYGSAFAVVATAFGVFRSWWGLLTIPAIALTGLVFAIIGLIYAYWIRRVDYLAYYWTLFITPMFMFAGVFFPLERLPEWVRTIAWFMPLYHAANLMRALMTQGRPIQAATSALWLAAVGGALILVPPIMLRRRLVG
jgi:lipooligosaccharide transport system permease protein